MCHFLYICFYIISDLYNHLSAMFLFFIISVYLSSVYIVSFYKFVFYILSRHRTIHVYCTRVCTVHLTCFRIWEAAAALGD